MGRRRSAAARAEALDALLAGTDVAARRAEDPVGLVQPYRDPADAEVAAVLAALLSFGRVGSFRAVIRGILALAEAAGGPRAWIAGFSEADARSLARFRHRWVRGADLVLLARTLQAVLARHGSLEAVFTEGLRPGDRDVGPALVRAVDTLREAALPLAGASRWRDLPHGFRHLLPSPRQGSACKRWCMLLRWMARDEAPDLGLWAIPTDRLVVPLDTHVHRIALLVGLTRRGDASWRTAVEITRGLAEAHRADPLRYDFALAHLGISGACPARPDPDRCRACPLAPICRLGWRAAARPPG